MALDNKNAAALSGGIVWGLGVFLLAVIAIYANYAAKVIDVLSSVYLGLAATWKGAFIGGIWAFIDAYIAIYIFLWLYEKFTR